jgi:hypothetical protein
MLNLTRWMTRHRWLVVCSWIVIAVGVLAASQAVGRRVSNNFSLPSTDSKRAVDLLKGSFPAQAGDADQIVFRTRTGTLDQPSVRAAIVPMLRRVAKLPHVAALQSPYAAGANAISKDRTVAFATVSFDQRANKLPKSAIERVIGTAEAARSSTLQVELGGQAIKQAQKAGLGFVTVVGIGAAIVVLLVTAACIGCTSTDRNTCTRRCRRVRCTERTSVIQRNLAISWTSISGSCRSAHAGYLSITLADSLSADFVELTSGTPTALTCGRGSTRHSASLPSPSQNEVIPRLELAADR